MTASFLLPTRGTCKPLVSRQGYESALVAVGRILEHRWSNPDRIIVHYRYQSAAASHPPGGIGSDGRSKTELLPGLPVRRIIVSGSAALLRSWRSRSSSTRDACRNVDLIGPFEAARRFVSALAHLRQESLGRAANRFHPLLGLLGLHADQPTRRPRVWRTQSKGISNP